MSLLLTSCANLNEEETTHEEEPNEISYADYTVYTSGSTIMLNKETVRMKPLLSYNKYSERDEIVYDLYSPYDDYYIDYDTLGESDIVVSGGGIAHSAQPNGNFLTNGYTRKNCVPINSVVRMIFRYACILILSVDMFGGIMSIISEDIRQKNRE